MNSGEYTLVGRTITLSPVRLSFPPQAPPSAPTLVLTPLPALGKMRRPGALQRIEQGFFAALFGGFFFMAGSFLLPLLR